MVGIIHYGMGNITSVYNALEFLKIPAKIIKEGDGLDEATHIILPGVGAFPEGMKNLHKFGFVEAIRRNVQEKKKPFLGICLGMQLLATLGHEVATTPGLDLIAGEVSRLPEAGVRIPHIGWNSLEAVRENQLIREPGDVYFVHSFYFAPIDPAAVIATTDYGIVFPSAVQRDNVYGVQFHPEKSQAVGLAILKNFYTVS